MRAAVEYRRTNQYGVEMTVVCWRCRDQETAFHDDFDRYSREEHLDHLLVQHDHGDSNEPEFWFEIYGPDVSLTGVDTPEGIRTLILYTLERYQLADVDVNVGRAEDERKTEPCAVYEYSRDKNGYFAVLMEGPADFHPLKVGS